MSKSHSLAQNFSLFGEEHKEVVGYKEVVVVSGDLTAKNSTNLQRDPAGMKDFVRGRGGFFPFAPGCLESDRAD